MKQRVLKTDAEREAFIAAYARRGYPVTIDYLRQCKVRAYFDKSNIIAGYVVNAQPPFRYLGWVPADKRPAIALYDQQDRLVEIACIFNHTGNVSTLTASLYLRAILDALLTGRDLVVGGGFSRVIYAIQSQILPHLVYNGPTETFGKVQRCWIYYGTRKEVVFLFVPKLLRNLWQYLRGRQPDYLAEARRKSASRPRR